MGLRLITKVKTVHQVDIVWPLLIFDFYLGLPHIIFHFHFVPILNICYVNYIVPNCGVSCSSPGEEESSNDSEELE